MAFLTDRALATGVSTNDLIHIVITGDTSQNPAGSSYKATMGQVLTLINPTNITGGTYDSVTGSITFFDDNGGSFTVTGLVTGFSDTFVTAFTYNNANTFTITENDNSTFSASINIVTGLTVNGSLSATTYLGLPSFTGGSGNCITDFYVTNIYGCSPITFHSEIQSTGSTASGSYSFAFGQGNTSSGAYSFSHGGGNLSEGWWSHAEGGGTSATTIYSHSEGINTLASGQWSHSEGAETIAAGDFCHSEGYQTYTSGEGCHAEGRETSSTGNFCHSEGAFTYSQTFYSHSEGFYSQALESSSHAEGGWQIGGFPVITVSGGTTNGAGSHAEGGLTITYGVGSHAEGSGTTTYGVCSHTEGVGTITVGDYQHAQGQFNLTASTQSAFIIGNGTDDLNRSNLVLAAGNTFNIYGDLNVSGTIYSTGSTQFISTTGITTSAVTLNSGITYNGISFSGNVDVTIPNPTNLTGLKLIIKDEGGYAGSYRIRVTPASGTIDGNPYVDMNINYMSLSFVARNNNWWII